MLSKEKIEEEKGDNKWHTQEKAAERQFDDYALKVANIIGPKVNAPQLQSVSGIDWLKVLNGCLWTYFLLAVFSSFMRSDFLSLTCIALAFMAISMPELHGRRTFRIITAYLVVTFVYDFIWMLLFRDSEAEDAENGGTGGFIRGFGSLCMVLSFFFRIAVFFVFWKVSLNYTKIFRD